MVAPLAHALAAEDGGGPLRETAPDGCSRPRARKREHPHVRHGRAARDLSAGHQDNALAFPHRGSIPIEGFWCLAFELQQRPSSDRIRVGIAHLQGASFGDLRLVTVGVCMAKREDLCRQRQAHATIRRGRHARQLRADQRATPHLITPRHDRLELIRMQVLTLRSTAGALQGLGLEHEHTIEHLHHIARGRAAGSLRRRMCRVAHERWELEDGREGYIWVRHAHHEGRVANRLRAERHVYHVEARILGCEGHRVGTVLVVLELRLQLVLA